MREPTNCDTCQSSLDNGYSYRYEGDKLVKALCFKCAKNENIQEYLKTKVLSSRLIMENNLSLYHSDIKGNIDDASYLQELKMKTDIQLSYLRIHRKMKEFEKEVWFKGLQKKVIDSRVKGVSAHTNMLNNFCVLTYSIAGRTMITIEDDTASVTFVADETSPEPRTGFQGISATEEKGISLIETVIKLYQDKKLFFKEDTNVNMGL